MLTQPSYSGDSSWHDMNHKDSLIVTINLFFESRSYCAVYYIRRSPSPALLWGLWGQEFHLHPGEKTLIK